MKKTLMILVLLVLSAGLQAGEFEEDFLEGCVEGCSAGSKEVPGGNSVYMCDCMCREMLVSYTGKELTEFIFRLFYKKTTDADDITLLVIMQKCRFKEMMEEHNGK